jgi:hypothetical protein
MLGKASERIPVPLGGSFDKDKPVASVGLFTDSRERLLPGGAWPRPSKSCAREKQALIAELAGAARRLTSRSRAS